MLTAPRTQISICSWETGTLIFATLNLIVLAAGIVAGFLNSFGNWNEFYITQLSLGCAVLSSFLMVFAVLLLHGVVKKRPEHIKAYFSFGAFMLSLSYFALLAFATFLDGWSSLIPPFYYWDPIVVVAFVMGQGVYGLILAMIYKTYRKMEVTGEDLDEPKHFLVENMNENVMPSYFKT